MMDAESDDETLEFDIEVVESSSSAPSNSSSIADSNHNQLNQQAANKATIMIILDDENVNNSRREDNNDNYLPHAIESAKVDDCQSQSAADRMFDCCPQLELLLSSSSDEDDDGPDEFIEFSDVQSMTFAMRNQVEIISNTNGDNTQQVRPDNQLIEEPQPTGGTKILQQTTNDAQATSSERPLIDTVCLASAEEHEQQQVSFTSGDGCVSSLPAATDSNQPTAQHLEAPASCCSCASSSPEVYYSLESLIPSNELIIESEEKDEQHIDGEVQVNDIVQEEASIKNTSVDNNSIETEAQIQQPVGEEATIERIDPSEAETAEVVEEIAALPIEQTTIPNNDENRDVAVSTEADEVQEEVNDLILEPPQAEEAIGTGNRLIKETEVPSGQELEKSQELEPKPEDEVEDHEPPQEAVEIETQPCELVEVVVPFETDSEKSPEIEPETMGLKASKPEEAKLEASDELIEEPVLRPEEPPAEHRAEIEVGIEASTKEPEEEIELVEEEDLLQQQNDVDLDAIESQPTNELNDLPDEKAEVEELGDKRWKEEIRRQLAPLWTEKPEKIAADASRENLNADNKTSSNNNLSSGAGSGSYFLQQEEDLEWEFDHEPEFERRQVSIKLASNPREEYELSNELGRGKFGTVFRCIERSTGRQFAAKFVHMRRKEDREDVIREIEIMSALQHKRLLQLYDAFDDGRQEMCLITELVEGGELFDRIVNDDFELTEKKAAIFVRQICEGVDYMHSQNIVHLDMKPENILCVSRTGNRIKLIDFGLARRLNGTEPLRVMFGTPDFAAPEVLAYETVSLATDMWSVGVICYVLLSGLSPFMGDSDIETMANVSRAAYDFDDAAFDPISDLAKDFISRLLVPQQGDRLRPSECLHHAWLQRGGAQLEAAVQSRRQSIAAGCYLSKRGSIAAGPQPIGGPGAALTTLHNASSVGVPMSLPCALNSLQESELEEDELIAAGRGPLLTTSEPATPSWPPVSLDKRNLKRYVVRRKWHRTVHAIMALGRMGAQLSLRAPL